MLVVGFRNFATSYYYNIQSMFIVMNDCKLNGRDLTL